MGLPETITKLINIYGVPAKLIKKSTTKNEYGDLVVNSQTILNIVVLPLDNPKSEYLRKLLGYSEKASLSYLTTESNIDIDDEIEILNKTYKLQSIEPIVFKNRVVAYIIKVV